MPAAAEHTRADADAIGALRSLCAHVRDSVKVDHVSLWVIDHRDSSIRPFATTRTDLDAGALQRWARIPLDDLPLVRLVMDRSAAVVVHAPQQDHRLPEGFAADLQLEPFGLHPLGTDRVRAVLAVEPPLEELEPWTEIHPIVAASVEAILARREAERHGTQAHILASLLRTIGEGSYGAALATVCRELAGYLGVRRATLFLLEDGRLVAAMSQFADGESRPDAWQRLRRTHGVPPLVHRVLDTGVPATAIADELDQQWATGFGLGAVLAVPVEGSGGITGVLVLDSPHERHFTAEQVSFASAVATGVAEVVDRARLWQRHADELQAATTVGQLLAAGMAAVTVDEAATALADTAREALRTEHAAVYLIDADARIDRILRVGVAPAVADELEGRLLGQPADAFALWRTTLGENRPVLVADTAVSELVPADVVAALRLRAYASLPVIAHGRPLGIVVCGHSQDVRRWRPSDQRLAERLAIEASVIIENAMLRDKQQQAAAIAEHAELLEIVATSAREVSVLDAAALDDALADAAARLGFDRLVTCLIEGADCHVTLSRGWQVSAGAVHAVRGIVADVVDRGDTVVAAGGDIEDPLLRGMEANDCVIAAPVHAEGPSVTGVLVVSRRGAPAGDHEIRAVELLASHIGRALMNAERFREAQASLDRLLVLDELKDDLLARVSHELRTPITVVKGLAQTLARRQAELDTGTRQDLLRRLAMNADQLEDIVTRLFDLARAERGKLEFRPAPLDLGALAARAVERLRDVLEDHPIETDLVEGDTVRGDPALLDRVLENLLTNAFRHTPPGTRILVSVRRTGSDRVEVAVSDDGPGIAPEHLDHLGQKFYRAGGSRQGLGIGLALVGEILRLHHSRLRVTSQPGCGATFSFELPVIDAGPSRTGG